MKFKSIELHKTKIEGNLPIIKFSSLSNQTEEKSVTHPLIKFFSFIQSNWVQIGFLFLLIYVIRENYFSKKSREKEAKEQTTLEAKKEEELKKTEEENSSPKQNVIEQQKE